MVAFIAEDLRGLIPKHYYDPYADPNRDSIMIELRATFFKHNIKELKSFNHNQFAWLSDGEIGW